eukprot:8103001-Lingulodinium_polyedra.AAC.1
MPRQSGRLQARRRRRRTARRGQPGFSSKIGGPPCGWKGSTRARAPQRPRARSSKNVGGLVQVPRLWRGGGRGQS